MNKQNRKGFKMLNKFLLLFAIVPALLFIACQKEIVSPEESSAASVKFKFGKSTSSNNNGIFFLNKFMPPAPKDLQLLKASGFDELKILCLDMTKFKSYQDFMDYWYNSHQTDLIDYHLWDSTKDNWDNYLLLLKKYPGDAYEYVGDYTFSISDSITKGTIFLNPGLNYFFYALRKGGVTGSFNETFFNIVKDSVNTITLQYQNEAPDFSDTPHPPDFAVGVKLNIVLKWVCNDPDFDNLTYNVYLGTSSSPPLVAQNITSSEYTPQQNLLPNSRYYWRVEASDGKHAIVSSYVWSFTTGQ